MCHRVLWPAPTFVLSKEKMASFSITDQQMKGIIYHANAARGMYSARLDNGYFTVFELIDQVELSRNTQVSGEFEGYGETEICVNEDRLHIHIDNFGLSEVHAFKKTFLIT